MGLTTLHLLLLIVGLFQVEGDCGAPSRPNSASDGSTDYTEGAKIEYTCNTGYEFPSAAGGTTYTIECGTDSQWTPTADCEKVQCPVLPADAQLSSTDHHYGDTVVMSCSHLTNYRIPGVEVGSDVTLTCLANKTWDFWDATNSLNGCIPIQCVYPLDPNAVGDNQAVAVGTITEFSCNFGYFFDDYSTVKVFECNSNADWENNSRTDWVCEPHQCDDLITTYNLTNVVQIPPTNFVGQQVIVACQEGHEFNDSSIEKYSMCQANETWDFIPFSCEPKLCPPVVNISNGNASTLDNWYPTLVNFTCWENFYFPDGGLWRISECNKYGKWSAAIPNCGDVNSIETNFQKEVYNVEGAQSYSIIAGSLVLVIIAAVIVLDVLTFGRQINFLKTNLMSRFECLRPEEEDDLESLDGDEVMRASVISLGRGRITPAASTVDLQYGEKSKQSQLNTLEDVEVVNEELGKVEIAGKKNLIPRTRLASAKSSIQRAITKAANVDLFKGKMMTTIRKNQFTSTGLPLGAENYGKIVEMRPPSPTKEDSDESDESDFTDDSDDEV